MYTFFIFMLFASANADVDAEDLIARGYTCSLTHTNPRLHLNTDIRRYVCDDGVCIECVLTGEKANPAKEFLDDPEDYIKAGFVCTPHKSRIPHFEAGIVCDDGVCFECKKPAWVGKRGDLDIFLRGGHKCFNVNDVPEDVLKDDVRVVCDDGYCFGCIEHHPTTSLNEEARVLTEPLGFAREYPVSRYLLDEAEDFLDDGYYCGLTNQINVQNRFGKERLVCEGTLCLVCRITSSGGNEKLVSVSEFVVERVKELVDISFKCFAVLERIDAKSDVDKKVLCDTEMCFICKSDKAFTTTSPKDEARVLTEPLAVAREFPVSRHFLDEIEDLLDDGHYCGLTSQINVHNRFGNEKVLCDGNLCLLCGHGSDGGKEKLVAVSEFVVERAKDLVDINFKCVAVLERIDVKSDANKKVLCDVEMCFICRSDHAF